MIETLPYAAAIVISVILVLYRVDLPEIYKLLHFNAKTKRMQVEQVYFHYRELAKRDEQIKELKEKLGNCQTQMGDFGDALGKARDQYEAKERELMEAKIALRDQTKRLVSSQDLVSELRRTIATGERTDTTYSERDIPEETTSSRRIPKGDT